MAELVDLAQRTVFSSADTTETIFWGRRRRQSPLKTSPFYNDLYPIVSVTRHLNRISIDLYHSRQACLFYELNLNSNFH